MDAAPFESTAGPGISPQNPHIGHLEELAADRRYEFAFVTLPLKIRGATGSMIRPVALV